jgi:hypothetical protein
MLAVIRRQFYQRSTRPAKRNRGLAVLLLACLAWGTTAEFTHHHGSQAGIGQRTTATSFADTASTALQSSNSGRTSSRSRSQAECLICQLHQNLSSSEINQPSLIGATTSQFAFAPSNLAVHLSEFNDTLRGRAPPTIP